MKTTLLAIFILAGCSIFAQEEKIQEFKLGLSANALFGNNLIGGGGGLNVQMNRYVFTLYGSSMSPIKVGNQTTENVMRNNSQVGLLAGYDITRSTKTSLYGQIGLCAGTAKWRGEKSTITPPADGFTKINGVSSEGFEEKSYNYFGVPISFNFNWYFHPNFGMKFIANSVVQNHPDYSFGFGFMFGYFGEYKPVEPIYMVE